MVFEKNTIVKLRNGQVGVVTSFNDKPSHIVFKAFCNPITKFNENLENSNHEYDIMEIYRGENLETLTDVWKKSFVFDEANLIWKRNDC